MVAVGEIVDPSDVDTRRLHSADLIGCLVEQFDTERKFVGDPAFQYPTHEPMVLIAGAWVDPVAVTAKGRPVAEILLNPERHECVSPASTEPVSSIARGRLQQRVESHGRDPTRLVLLDEAVLDPKFSITRSQR